MYSADLHVHTKVSDGSFTAEEILKEAKQNGITHIAFTEHDTTAFSEEHMKLAEEYGIKAVRAIEISAYDSVSGKKVHILGYGYQNTTNIESLVSDTLNKRNENGIKQINILKHLRYAIGEQEVREIRQGCIYKQHILDYLVRTKQEIELFGQVYNKIFKDGGPCDFDIIYPEAKDAVTAICADGGRAVLAHPLQQQNLELAEVLVKYGLSGIECVHPSHTEHDMEEIAAFAGANGLFLTGGSDFHGRYEKKSFKLGSYTAPSSSKVIFRMQ